MNWQSEQRMRKIEERLATAQTAQEYREAMRHYQLERSLREPFGQFMWHLGSTLPGCWLAITMILCGGWTSLKWMMAGSFASGYAVLFVTVLFGLAWWSVNRYAVRVED